MSSETDENSKKKSSDDPDEDDDVVPVPTNNTNLCHKSTAKISSETDENAKRKSSDDPDEEEEEEEEEEESQPAPKILKLAHCDIIGSKETLIEFESIGDKINRETQTEEEYITNIEKTLKIYHENYKELETEEYKQMLQKFYTQNLRLATRCQKLKGAVEKNTSTTARILREASKSVNPHQLAFISAQLINNGKPPKKRVWSPQMKIIMVGLYQVSPSAYSFLSKVLLLPEEEEVTLWMKHGVECDVVEEGAKRGSSKEDSAITMEAQAILDEIAFENLMSTLL